MSKLDEIVEDSRQSEPTRREWPIAESLSKGWLPPTYRNHYAWLVINQPEKAQAFWDKWVVRPR